MSKELRMRPVRDYLLLELKEKGSKVGNIYVTPTDKVEFEDSALVVGVGPDVKSVSIGDMVMFDGRSGHRYSLQDTTYLFIQERDVHGVTEVK